MEVDKVSKQAGGKEAEWAYYHLIAMEYPESLIAEARAKITPILANRKNKDRYRAAYVLLAACVVKSEGLFKIHKDKAMEHIETLLAAEKAVEVSRKRRAETAALVRMRSTSTEEDDIKFTRANEIK